MKNLEEFINESIEDLPKVETLGDGLFTGQLSGNCFTFECKKYYSPISILSIAPGPYYTFEIKEGKVIRHGDLNDLKDFHYESPLSFYNINEALDYKAENCDGACDRRSDYFKECMKLLKEHITKLREDQEKYKKEEDYYKGVWDYTLIGMVNPVLQMFIDTHNEYYIDNEIVGILEDAINNVTNDLKFHEGWKDGPEKLDKNLEQYKKQVQKYKQQVQEIHNSSNKINYDIVNGIVVGSSNKK